MGGVMVDTDIGFFKIAGIASRDIDKGLRVQVHEGEPAALHLYHDAVSFFKSVGDLVEVEGDFRNLSGNERLGLFIAVAEFTAEDIRPDQALITRGIGCRGNAILLTR
jgi:hypothetical protein